MGKSEKFKWSEKEKDMSEEFCFKCQLEIGINIYMKSANLEKESKGKDL